MYAKGLWELRGPGQSTQKPAVAPLHALRHSGRMPLMVVGPPNWIGIDDGMNVAFQSGGFRGLFPLTMHFALTYGHNRE